MRVLPLLAAAMIASCALGAAPPASGVDAAVGRCPGATRVPMVEWDGVRPAVHVMVNGSGPYLFLIDTGAQGLARADTRLVETLALPVSGQTEIDDGSAAGNLSAPEVTMAMVDVGGLVFRDVVAPSRSYNSNPDIVPIDGILGFNLFADCLLTLDYAARMASVGPGELRPGEAGVVSYTAPHDTAIVAIEIAGVEGEADLDSGDRQDFTLPGAMAATLPLGAEPRVVGSGRSANNVFEIRRAPLVGAVRIGETVWRNPEISFADPFDNINIGSAALQGMSVTFDQRNRLVRLSRPTE